MKLVCEECGSDDIQTLMWVNVNTNKIEDSYDTDEENNWCNKCESHLNFITEEEFLKLNEEEL